MSTGDTIPLSEDYSGEDGTYTGYSYEASYSQTTAVQPEGDTPTSLDGSSNLPSPVLKHANKSMKRTYSKLATIVDELSDDQYLREKLYTSGKIMILASVVTCVLYKLMGWAAPLRVLGYPATTLCFYLAITMTHLGFEALKRFVFARDIHEDELTAKYCAFRYEKYLPIPLALVGTGLMGLGVGMTGTPPSLYYYHIGTGNVPALLGFIISMGAYLAMLVKGRPKMMKKMNKKFPKTTLKDKLYKVLKIDKTAIKGGESEPLTASLEGGVEVKEDKEIELPIEHFVLLGSCLFVMIILTIASTFREAETVTSILMRPWVWTRPIMNTIFCGMILGVISMLFRSVSLSGVSLENLSFHQAIATGIGYGQAKEMEALDENEEASENDRAKSIDQISFPVIIAFIQLLIGFLLSVIEGRHGQASQAISHAHWVAIVIGNIAIGIGMALWDGSDTQIWSDILTMRWQPVIGAGAFATGFLATSIPGIYLYNI